MCFGLETNVGTLLSNGIRVLLTILISRSAHNQQFLNSTLRLWTATEDVILYVDVFK